jgi:predicted sugar kinase
MDTTATNRKHQVNAIKDKYDALLRPLYDWRDVAPSNMWDMIYRQIDKLIDEREAEIEATRQHPADEAQQMSAIEVMDVIDTKLETAWGEFNRIEDAVNDLYGQVFYGGEVGEFTPYRKTTDDTEDIPF